LEQLQRSGSISSSLSLANLITPDLWLKVVNGKQIVVGFALPSIFDKFAYISLNRTVPESLGDKFQQLSRFCMQSSISEWAQGFLGSNEVAVAKELFDIATTTQSMFLKTKDVPLDSSFRFNPSAPEQLTLYTAPGKPPALVFQTGSSLSHCDQAAYTTSAEFLMRPFSTSGVTLAQLKQSNGNAVMGPKTQMVLALMGYEVRGISGVSRSTIKRTLGSCLQASSAVGRSAGVLGPSFIVYLALMLATIKSCVLCI
jgi:hypothetical protein